MTTSTSDSAHESEEQAPNVDPAVDKYYREMAQGWGAHLSKGWRGWPRRLAFWR